MDMSEWFLDRTADEWFADALRWFVEEHQGCPCCRDRHCVFRAQWGPRVEFYCTSCDFSTACDRRSNRCTVAGGESPPDVELLLGGDWPFEIHPALS